MDLNIYLKEFLEDISLFMGSLVPLFWTFGDICHEFQSQGFQNQGGFPRFRASLPVFNRYPIFTSGAISADLLVASMAPEPFEAFQSYTCLQALIGSSTGSIVWLPRRVR